MNKHIIKSILALVLAGIPTVGFCEEKVTAYFDWSNPAGLTPSFQAPASGDKIGVMINDATFSDNGVTFFIDDSNVKEQSRKARFYFGYYTNAVELRAYAESYFVITAPEGKVIESITMTGPEVGEYYLTPLDETGKWSNDTWTAGTDAQQVKFYLDTRCEMSTTSVTCKTAASVDDIALEYDQTPGKWFDLSGRIINSEPQTPGLYLYQQGHKITKKIIK